MNMELMGAMGEGEWGSLSGMYYSTEEADFMAQLLSIPSEPEGSSGLWPAHESVDGSFYSSDNMEANLYYHLNESHPNMVGSLDFSMEGPKSSDGFPGRVLADDPMGADDCLNEGTGGNLLHEFALPDKNSQVERDTVMEDGKNPPENSKKRPRSSANVPKKKRNAKSKKSSNPVSVGEDSASNGGLNANSSSSCCSEDETSMASQDQNGGVSSSSAALKGKTRASRGSATDPQSLYARKRRERINERLRILQNLVPNGTKVDISTMLEEAVQYVKFLQLQIKLLSSDDLWMYAPIAYNGMNIGLDMNLTTPR